MCCIQWLWRILFWGGGTWLLSLCRNLQHNVPATFLAVLLVHFVQGRLGVLFFHSSAVVKKVLSSASSSNSKCWDLRLLFFYSFPTCVTAVEDTILCQEKCGEWGAVSSGGKSPSTHYLWGHQQQCWNDFDFIDAGELADRVVSLWGFGCTLVLYFSIGYRLQISQCDQS